MNASDSFLIVEVLQVTAVAGAALLLMLCTIRRSALRHALGVVGVGLVLTTPLLTLLLPRPGWLPEPERPAELVAESIVEPVAAPPLRTETDQEFGNDVTAFETAWPYESDAATLSPFDELELREDQVPAALPPWPAVSEPASSDRWVGMRTAIRDRLPYLLSVAGLLWIAGTAWFLFRWLQSHVRLRRLRESLIAWPAERPIYEAGAICEELGLRELPPIKVSEIAPMPLVLGVLRPVIVLPRALTETHNPCRLRDVVLHEAAHIARRDPLVFITQRVAATVFWWHPGIHWLNRAISRAREEVCDNHVLRRGDAAAYAELLLELVESYAGLRLELSLMGLLAPRWSLEQRIAGLLNPGRNTMTRAGRVRVTAAAALLAAVCIGVGGVGAVGGISADTTNAVASQPVEQTPESNSGSEILRVSPTPTAETSLPRSGNWPNFRNGTDLRGIAGATLPEKLDLLWELETHDGVTATAAIADGRAYVGELSGNIRSLDLHSGQEYWHYRTIESQDPEVFAPGFNAPVTVSETALFIGDEEGTFYALDRESGTLLWKISTDGEIKGGATVLPPDPITGEARVMFGSHDGTLYCLNAVTGDQMWTFDAKGPVNASQAVAGQFTFVSGCDLPVLRIVDVNSGEQHAEIPLDDSLLIASPAVVDNMLYFGTQDGSVNAFDWQSKLRMWIWLDPKEQQIHSSPTVTDDLVLIGSRDKRLHALNRKNGEQMWAFETRGPIDSSPVVVAERIFFGSADRHVYGVDFSGQEVWKHNAGRRISASPAVGEGHMIIGCEGPGGQIMCFGAKRKVAFAVSQTNDATDKELKKVTLRGTCQDENEQPLAGVRVRMFRFPSSVDPPELIAEAVTGKDGKYEFAGLESAVDLIETRGIGDLVVVGTADGRTSAGRHIGEDGNEVEQQLQLPGDAGAFSGFVHDAEGQPVVGAEVFLPRFSFQHPVPGYLTGTTDANGKYEITGYWRVMPTEFHNRKTGTTDKIGEMRTKLMIRHPDYGTVNVWNAVIDRPGEATRVFDITLSSPAIVAGRVIDAVTNNPAAGVIVTAQGIGRHGFYQTRTDSEGRYELRLTKDLYNIWADMPDRIAIAVKAIEAKPGETVSNADIQIVRGGFVYGSVIDPGTRKPVRPKDGEVMHVAHQGPARPRTDRARTLTTVQADGTYRLRVAPGRNLIFLSGGSRGVYVDVADCAEVRHDVAIGEGTEVDSAESDPDVALRERLIREAIAEDNAGVLRAREPDNVPGNDQSAVPPTGGRDANDANAAPVQDKSSEEDSEPIAPGDSALFRGQVHGPDGQPLAGARIYIVRYDRSRSGWAETQRISDSGPVRTVTNDDGIFAFYAPDMVALEHDGQPARLDGLIIAAADGYAPDWAAVWSRERMIGRRRGLSIQEFELHLGRDDVPIEGQLLDPDGRPITGAVVQLVELKIPQKRTLDTYLEYVMRDDSRAGNGPEFDRRLSTPAVLPGVTVRAATDSAGRFTLTGLGSERIAELAVSAPGMVDTDLTVMTRDAPDAGSLLWQGKPKYVTHGARFSVRLKAGHTVNGVVIDSETRAPIPGMWVGLRTGESPLEGLSTGMYHRATDANGRFTITGVRPELLESGDRQFREVVAVSPPGVPYEAAAALLTESGEIVIECPRGIPIQLKVTDEEGKPVEADVTYVDLQPNPHAERVRRAMNPHVMDGSRPISRGATRGDGIYAGFAIAGPGAVLVRTPDSAGYRPAQVVPKSFFAPDRDEWTAQERISAYGTRDTLSTWGAWINQHDYSAIVLINPTEGSATLELNATVYKDRPRQVTLVDPEGQPVTGTTTEGMTFHPWDRELPLRSATFPVGGLHPDWGRRITFYDEARRLIGFLMARGDAASPHTVQMQPWAGLKGRIVDADGDPLDVSLDLGGSHQLTVNPDPQAGTGGWGGSDKDGNFRIDRLVPGQRYAARALYDQKHIGTAFADVVLQPGEVRDLGDIRLERPMGETQPSAVPAHDQGTNKPGTAGETALGGVEGQFVFDGEPPQLAPLKTKEGQSVPDESLIVNSENKGIANVCVYLQRAPEDMPRKLWKIGKEPAVFDVENRRFVPHVFVVRTGQQVLLKNDDAVTVNVHSMNRHNRSANVILREKDRDGVALHMHQSELRSEPVRVKSDLQPWMSAFWLVSDHPYVAVTDADGRFKIENLPAGDHTFRVWHERAGYIDPTVNQRDLTVIVEAGKAVGLPVFRVGAQTFER